MDNRGNRDDDILVFLLPLTEKQGGAYLEVATHVQRGSFLHTVELVGKQVVAQLHA